VKEGKSKKRGGKRKEIDKIGGRETEGGEGIDLRSPIL
jgi:hypothetical protein